MDIFNSIFAAIEEILAILNIDLGLGDLKGTVDQIIAVIEGIEF